MARTTSVLSPLLFSVFLFAFPFYGATQTGTGSKPADSSQKDASTSRSCTDEEEACKARCSSAYGYKGKDLDNCKNIACAASWRQCMKNGSWHIGRTGQTIAPLRKE
jgi:hypothetical protein